ncbi:MAG TPA: signal peptidase I [Patescibacteria group bacterium]|jgi:signal peptidase I
MKKIGALFTDLMETVIISLSIFLVVYLFFMQPHQVNGQSMVPNFQNGDYVLTDKISYRLGSPQRGEVIVFHAPPAANCVEGTGCDFIKRVLALPGETVAVRDGKIFVNDRALPEDYLPSDLKTNPGPFTQNGPITLGADEYLAVGDNRSHSSDSRFWGPIHRSDIVGKAFFRYWPPGSIGAIVAASYSF